MKRFIFSTGLISVLAGIGLQFPVVASRLMPATQPGMLLHLFAVMAIFLGVMLMLCVRDLRRRAPLVAWEGILRLCGFCIMAGYGTFGGEGKELALSGVFDLVVGLAYLVGLPRHLGLPLIDILLDRPADGAGVSP